MPAPVFYSCSMFGTGTVETGDGNITITSGVAVLSVEQTGNIGVGVEIEYNSLHAYIAPNRIGFDSGGTAELLTDTKIEGGTSGATGIVRFVEVLSGTWAGGDAAGWIYFEKTTGTFQNDEQINRIKPTVSNNIATTDGTIEGNIGNGNTEFVVKSAIGADAANQTETSVTSIHHVWATLSAFEGAFTGASYINNADLTAADVVAHACFYYDHDNYTQDTTRVEFDWTGTTDATRFLVVFAPLGNAESINRQSHSGIWDDNKAIINWTSTASLLGVLDCSEDYIRFQNLQVGCVSDVAYSNLRCIYTRATGASNYKLINSCVLRLTGTSATSFYGIELDNTNDVVDIINTVLYRNFSVDGNSLFLDNCTTVKILHCTVRGNSSTIDGIERDVGDVTVKNTVSFDHLDDFDGTFVSIDYCASDDGDGTNAVDWDAGAVDWALVFNDYANGDFSLKDYTGASKIIEEGTSLAASEGIWRDIAGNERGATPDIGAFEYVAAGEDGWTWGEQNPNPETPVEWSAWKIKETINDARDSGDWGLLQLGSNEEFVSDVKDLGSAVTRYLKTSYDDYAVGSGSGTLYWRGQAAIFNYNDNEVAGPTWELYSPGNKSWRYVQLMCVG